MNKTATYILILLAIILQAACSTTSNLPEGEKLYTGVKKVEIIDADASDNGEAALTEVYAAIELPPNGSFFGSATLANPWPMGLMIHNAFASYADKHGPGNWIYRKMGSRPILASEVNAPTRAQLATNLLHDYGYFNGKVSHIENPSKRNPRKTRYSYTIYMGRPYYYDSIRYERFPGFCRELLRTTEKERKIKKGENFTVISLLEERNRISGLMRDNGFYHYHPEFVGFRADTLRHSGYVDMKIAPVRGLPREAHKRYKIGRTTFNIINPAKAGEREDSVRIGDFTVKYRGKRPDIKPEVLKRHYYLYPGQWYSETWHQLSRQSVSRLGVFQMTEFRFKPREENRNDSIDIMVNATMMKPYEGTLALNVATKSNDQAGPGTSFSLTRHNFMRSAAALTLKLSGSYEWQTHSSDVQKGSTSRSVNSYELGASINLDYPELILPWTRGRGDSYHYPSHTGFRLYANELNRSKFFKMLSFGGSVTYDYQHSASWKHTIMPFKLTFNTLRRTTSDFDKIMEGSHILRMALGNQFIPAAGYTITYDNSPSKPRHKLWWETSFTSAGNATSALYALSGEKFSKTNKQLLNSPFAQFIKLTSEIRTLMKISGRHKLAMRLMGGIVYSYGNMDVTPFSEQFYIGGANSIRAFTIRSIGPGRYHPGGDNRLGYIDETGDIKFEANAEYRFPIMGELNGAIFLDMGNVWMLRDDPDRPGGRLAMRRLLKDMALGTGFGLRYDLEFLVVRLDLGIGLHAPYDTGRKGYYNMPKFKDSLGLHFAIGYPF